MLYKQIWDTLSSIDPTPGIEKKNGLDFISWSFAWSQVKKYFPDIHPEFTERTFPDQTVEVTCRITIRQGEETAVHEMWLPVLDFRNKPIQCPDAFAINTSRQRCMVKCLALFGLGIEVYGGTVDMPVQSNVAVSGAITKKQVSELKKMLKAASADVDKFLAYFGASTLDQLPADRWENIIGMLEAKIANQGAANADQK